MNAVYAALDALQPTADQLRELWREAVHVATVGTEAERAAAALFCHQLRFHVQRRIERQKAR